MEEIIFASGSVGGSCSTSLRERRIWFEPASYLGGCRSEKATRSGKLVTNLEEMNSKGTDASTFYISPKLLWQETGYIWRGERA